MNGHDRRPRSISGQVGITGGEVVVTEPIDVLGTFWQATQPVSGTVAVSAVAGYVSTTTYDLGELAAGTTFVHTSGTTLASAASYVHLLVTPASPSVQVADLLLSVDSGPFGVFLYEDTVTSNDGTATTFRNQNRTNVAAASTAVYHTPTVSSDGTEIFYAMVPGTNAASSIFGPTGSIRLVLKPSTKYLIRCTNNNSNGVSVGFAIRIIEGSLP